ncbi:related to pol protein [Ustilago sp. UG-2017b]|nr:related to pol protein [Ustilago sp. UG-2017b]
MTDQDLNSKLDRLLALLEAQLELTRQGQREERLRRAHLSREETIDLSHSDEQAGGGDESMIGDPHTPTPALRPRPSVSFANLDEQDDVNYEKYASPTGPRYVKSRVDPYNKSRTEHYVLDQEEDSSIMAEPNRSKPIATPFPKFDPRDVEIFILEAEAWFKFNQVYEQSRMINHMGAQLEGNAREWWTSKLRIDRAREGRLFNDWHYFTERLTEQFNPRNARMEAYNKLLALRLTSDAPGVATRHVERFRDLEGQVNLDDNELVIDLFRGSLTCSLQEKFERNPPRKRWEWYREVEEIDRQRMLQQQSSARHPNAAPPQLNPGTRPTPPAQGTFSARQPTQPYLARQQPSTPTGNPNQATNRPLPHQLTQGPRQGSSAPAGNNTCHVCKGIGHWARECPSRKVDPLSSRPMGPKVMVTTADPFEEATDSGDGHTGSTETGDPEAMDLSPYQQSMDPDHEEEQDDDDEEGNDSKAVLELSGTVQDHPARILADTGAGLSIVSDSFISKYQIPTKPTKTRSIHGVTGHQLSINSSATIRVAIGTHNLGVVEVSVADTADYDLILGFTELRKLKPTIRWDTGQLEFKTQEQDRPPKRPPEAARAGDLSMRRSTLHGNEFVSAEHILQAALEDGPIGFMLLEEPPSSLLAFGFVPTGADKGVEMEVEVDEEVTAADIPKPYQHLRDVFDEVEADKLPHHTEHDLHLELIEGGQPPQGPLYLKGPREMSELRKYLEEKLEKGFIRPSKSPARSPVLFVPKKDGGLRLCVDYRGLNEITVKNRAPLPLIEEQLFLLRKARIYTKLDLRAAYNLIRIAKGDEWKTAFGTQLGLYEYLVMPFGLANAPAHFQSFINGVFRDIIGVYVVVYLDDFLIFSDTEESHVKHVTEVLTRLRSNRLFAKLSKCEFHTKTVEFLGYIIKPTGIEMDPEKVRTVKEWPMPESIHDIQRFLGFANFYRRFIAHFARIAKPLTSLVKPTERFKKFELPEEAQQAFHKLIRAFASAGVLQHFDYHLPTRLETDASDFAIAGVLKQEHEGRWHPVAFYSRKMSSAERNYEIHDKELLAVVACLTQWRHMLAGLPSQLVILTDHEALKYFKSQRRITGRHARWAVLLADFDFILQYRPGDKGGEPDALTRRADMQPAGEEQEHNVRQLLPPRVFKETADHESTLVAPMLSMESIASKGLKDLVKIFQPLDQELQGIHTKKPFEVKDDLWCSGGRLVIPRVTMPGKTNNRHSRSAKEVDGQSLSVEHLRFMVMTQCHDGITAGHVGRDATIKAAQRHYWWPSMTAWIADYVASCPVCARYKAPLHRPYGLLQPLATPDRPWGSISLDFIEGLPPSRKYDSILVIVDRLTKFAILAPTYKTVTAKQTAVLLHGHMVRLFGYPDHMVSDRGRQFISGAWKAFAEQMGVKHSLSTAYHPQTDGQMERVNQVVEQYLRMYCNYEQNDWADLLDTAAFVYNNTVHNSIGVSPFFACYGWNPKAHPDIPQRLGVHDPDLFEYLIDGKEHCKYLQEQIREAQRRTVDQYNRKHKDIEFKEWVGRRAYRITLPANLRVHDVFHVSMLEPARTSSLAQWAEQPTIPSLPDEDLDFEVEALIDKRSHLGVIEYKVLWRGYSEEAASWEPVSNLNCPDLIQEYEVSEGGRTSRRRSSEQEE